MKKRIFGAILFFLIAATAIGCHTNDLPDEFNMTIIELNDAISADSNLVILDVRTPGELTGPLGQIEGAINIPVQVLEKRLNEIEKFKGNNIAVICRSGNRSIAATKILQKNGFSAKNVLGGMIEFNKK